MPHHCLPVPRDITTNHVHIIRSVDISEQGEHEVTYTSLCSHLPGRVQRQHILQKGTSHTSQNESNVVEGLRHDHVLYSTTFPPCEISPQGRITNHNNPVKSWTVPEDVPKPCPLQRRVACNTLSGPIEVGPEKDLPQPAGPFQIRTLEGLIETSSKRQALEQRRPGKPRNRSIDTPVRKLYKRSWTRHALELLDEVLPDRQSF